MFAGGQRLECELEMKPRRHRNHHRVDGRIFDRGGVSSVVGEPEIAPMIALRRLAIAAGIAADNGIAEPSQMSTVNLGDEAAPEKRDVYRRRHRFMISRGDAGQNTVRRGAATSVVS